jgi:hypothetical protein
MFGNFLGFPGGTEGSCGGYMVDRVHQLQTLDQLSGRPRNLREAGEARRERTLLYFCYNLLYPAYVPRDACTRGSCISVSCDAVEGVKVMKRNKFFFLFIAEN